MENKKYDKIKNGDYFKEETVRKMSLPTPPKHIIGMNIPYMWEHGYTGKGIKVAIIDTGCDINNKYIKDKIKFYCNMSDDDDRNEKIMNDYFGHGTHIAGLIASDSFEDKVIGIAPDVDLYIYKVVDKSGFADYDDIKRAINHCISMNVDIINISLGGTQEASQIHEVIKEAISCGISIVGSAGNNGDGNEDTIEMLFPSCYDEVIEVGSINDKNKISIFSNSNQFVDCVTYGENLLSLSHNGNFEVLTGTSQSAPLVTGTIALIKQWANEEYHRKLSETEIYSLLIKNTKSLSKTSRNQQGHGMIYLKPSILR